jgi:beta-lactamase regulating signal transducer with metallopeptidase domain
MNHYAEVLSPSVLRPVGLALVHFLWEGVALAALLSAALAMTRRASTRYALAVGTLLLMVATPVATYFVVRGASAIAPIAADATAATQSQPASASVQAYIAALPAHIARAATKNVRPDLLFWLVQVWMAGVLLLSLRNLGGLVLIERLRRKESVPVGEALLEKCLALQRRLRLDRVIRYCECHRLDAPAVIGWFRPVVLLPATALTGLSEEQLSAVIAHELAHIQRLDSFVNLFQVAVETVLFYHPAVWWVSRKIRMERENCCDDAAIQVSGDALQYARALTAMAERRVAPTLAMAVNRSPLEARVMRLLGLEKLGTGLRTAGLAASVLCLAGAVFAGNAIVGTAQVSLGQGGASAILQEAKQTPVVQAFSNVVSRAMTNVRARVRANVEERVAVNAATQVKTSAAGGEGTQDQVAAAQDSSAASQEHASASQDQATAAQDAGTAKQEAKSSYIDSMRAQGLDNLSIDELVELKIQGVTADYVKSLHDLGLKPSVDEIVSMKVQGVTSDYIKGLMGLGWKPNIDEIVAMKVQGVTDDYAKSFSDLGLKPDLDELIALKVQGVSPEYVREMRASGIDAGTDEIIGLKVQGVTPEYVKSVHDLGWKADADTVIGLKVQGVTPDYIREMKAAGLDGDADAFIGMKVQGVTPEYLKQMHDLGLKFDADDVIGMKVQGVTPDYILAIRATGLNPDKDDIVGMKVQGVTAEYIKALQAAGFKDVNVDNVIGAKVQGITPEFIAEAQKHGFKDLTLEKLIDLKRADIF